MALTGRAIEVNVDQTKIVSGDPIFATEPIEFRIGPVPISAVATAGANWAAAAAAGGTLADGDWYVGFTYMIPVGVGLTLETDLSQTVKVTLGAGDNTISVTDVKKLEPANALNLLGGIQPAVYSVRCWIYNGTTYYMVSEQTVATDGTIASDTLTIANTTGAPTSGTIPGEKINIASTLYSMNVGTQYIGTSYKKWYCITCRNLVPATAVSKMDTGRGRIIQNISGTDLAGAYTRIQLWDQGTSAWKDCTLGSQTVDGVALQHQLPADSGAGEPEEAPSTQHTELTNGFTTEEPAVTVPLVAGTHTHTHRYCDGALIFAFNFTSDFPVTGFNIPVDVTWRLNVV